MQTQHIQGQYLAPHQQQPPASPQQSFQKPPDEVFVTESQNCGQALVFLGLIWGIMYIFCLLLYNMLEYEDLLKHKVYIVILVIRMIISFSFIYFNFKIMTDQEYLAGKPDAKKFWPHWVSLGCVLINGCISKMFLNHIIRKLDFYLIRDIIFDLAYITASYLAFSQDDFGGSTCLCLKPYVKVKHVAQLYRINLENLYPAVHPGMGQPMGYPQQQPAFSQPQPQGLYVYL